MAFKISTILLVALVVGVAGGTGYFFWRDSHRKKPLSMLTKNSFCTETLYGKECKDWFMDQKKQHPKVKQGILLKPTEEWIDRLGYKKDSEIDLQFYLLQVVLDSQDNCMAHRMINYGQLSSKLSDSLQKDGILVFEL